MTRRTPFVALIGLLALLGCGTPELRPGLTGAEDLAGRTLPAGKVYSYLMTDDDLPVDIAMTFRSERLGPNRMRYRGQMSLDAPSPELAEVLAEAAREDGAEVTQTGSRLSFPIRFVTDGQGRAVESTLFNGRSVYRPHDCSVTVGTCRYRETENGQTTSWIVETREEGGLWRSEAQNRNDPTERVYTDMTLDADGFMLDVDFVTLKDGRSSLVRVRRQN